MKKDKEELMAELKKLGVHQLHIEYSGSGDDGQVQNITAFIGDDKYDIDELFDQANPNEIAVKVADEMLGRSSDKLSDRLELFAYEALNHVNASDWINNEGGGGTIVFFVEEGEYTSNGEFYPAGHIHFDHYWNKTEAVYETYSL